MQQIKEPKMQELVKESNSFYLNLLGYISEKTSLNQIPENEWCGFAQTRGLDPNSSGIYLPRNQTVIVRNENPLSLFHEYFGHGLYCEQNLTGRKLVDLERKLLEEEKQFFEGKNFSLGDLQKFRKQNLTFQELDNYRRENLGRYEGFAVWSEYLLSREFGLDEDFEKKYDSLIKQDREAIDSIINFSKTYGDLATFYAQGMARRTTAERVGGLLEDVYKDKLQDVSFALLYGSKKDFSDIDVFMVGSNIPSEVHSDWLDVKYKPHKEFKKGLKNFDVRIIVPLMNGELIFGDKDYFEETVQKTLTQPITKEAIIYNLKWSSRMQRLRDENLGNEFLRNKFEGYSKTYLANALALKQGLRLFSKEDLLSYSQQEKQIQLKGGTENNAT